MINRFIPTNGVSTGKAFADSLRAGVSQASIVEAKATRARRARAALKRLREDATGVAAKVAKMDEADTDTTDLQEDDGELSSALQACYAAALKSDPALAAKLHRMLLDLHAAPAADTDTAGDDVTVDDTTEGRRQTRRSFC